MKQFVALSVLLAACSGPGFSEGADAGAQDPLGNPSEEDATETEAPPSSGTLPGSSGTAAAGTELDLHPELPGTVLQPNQGVDGGKLSSSGIEDGTETEPATETETSVGVDAGEGLEPEATGDGGTDPGTELVPDEPTTMDDGAEKVPCTLGDEDKGEQRIMHDECPSEAPYCQRHGYCGNDVWESPECTRPGYDFLDVDGFHCDGRCNAWLVCVEG